MSTLTIEIHCPMCGGDVERITQGKRGYGATIVARCVGRRNCQYEYVINLDVIHARTNEGGEPTHCGSDGGFSRHKRAKEEACDLCKQAHIDAQQRRKIKKRQVMA